MNLNRRQQTVSAAFDSPVFLITVWLNCSGRIYDLPEHPFPVASTISDEKSSLGMTLRGRVCVRCRMQVQRLRVDIKRVRFVECSVSQTHDRTLIICFVDVHWDPCAEV